MIPDSRFFVNLPRRCNESVGVTADSCCDMVRIRQSTRELEEV